MQKTVLNDKQAAFVPEEGIDSHKGSTISTSIHLQNTKKADESPYYLFIDLSKAFDCIPRRAIYIALKKAGVPK